MKYNTTCYLLRIPTVDCKAGLVMVIPESIGYETNIIGEKKVEMEKVCVPGSALFLDRHFFSIAGFVYAGTQV